mgnify:CR=1 FL=1|jgi:hypothetical protein
MEHLKTVHRDEILNLDTAETQHFMTKLSFKECLILLKSYPFVDRLKIVEQLNLAPMMKKRLIYCHQTT